MHCHIPGHLAPIIATSPEGWYGFDQVSSSLWTSKPRTEIIREVGKGRHNERGKFCNKTSLWKWNSLSGFLFLEVILQQDSDTTLLYLPPPFSIGHLLCSSQRYLSLSNHIPTKIESQDEVRLLTSLAPYHSWDKPQAEPSNLYLPSDLGSEQMI